MSIQDQIQDLISEAKLNAYLGNVEKVQSCLRKVRAYSNEFGIGIPELEKIEQIAYKNAAELALKLAKTFAAIGRVEATEYCIVDLRVYATKAGMEIPEQEIWNIKQNAYENGVRAALECARNAASQGRAKLTLGFLETARAYATEAGIKIPEQEIEDIGQLLKKYLED